LKSIPQVVEKECKTVYNLTSGQISHDCAYILTAHFSGIEDAAKVLLLGPSTLAEKCFLKCYGEGTELVCFIFAPLSFFYHMKILDSKWKSR
jgi:hypothetical protein